MSLERVVAELAPDDRRHLQQLVGLRREPVQPPPQGLPHAVGDGDVGDGVLVQRPFLGHEVHDLGEEEGVALGLLVDAVQHLAPRRHVGLGLDVARDFVPAQAAQDDALEAALAVEDGQRLRERALAGDVGVAVVAGDEDARPRQLAG